MERIAPAEVSPWAIEFDPENRKELGPCPHCGQMTKRVWGYVYQSEIAIAAYYVEWNPDHTPREAMLDLIVGKWGEDSSAADRKAIAVEFKMLENGPAFMVQDAGERRVARSPLVSKALRQNDVVNTPLADTEFRVCELARFYDPRIRDLQR